MDTVLLLDDARDSLQTFQDLFESVGIANPLASVASPEEARKFLLNIKGPRGRRAGVVLVDLHLPECQAFSFLQWLKSEQELQDVLKIAVVERSRLKDVVRAYELGAHTFLVKPPTSDGLKTVLQSFPDWWIFVSPPSSGQA